MALFLGISLVGVLLLGGASIFFARSIYMAAEEIRREHNETEIAARIHSAFHHFVFALQRAVILSRPVPERVGSAYREELTQLLTHEHRYHQELPEQKIVDEFRRGSAALFTLAGKIGIEGPQGGAGLNRQHLDELENIASNTQIWAHGLSIAHTARMDKLLEQNKSSMQWIFAFYVIFFLIGTALVFGSSFYFGHTIARPLRRLARSAEGITRGGMQEKLPVESGDEVGLLTHTFNVMVQRLAESDAKLRRLAILEERERIAAELHDSLAQSLAFLNLKLNELKSDLAKESPAASDTTVTEMQKMVGTAYDEVRDSIFGLRAERPEKTGFIASLTEFLHNYGAMRKVSIDINVPNPEAVRLAPHAEVQLIRIIQEALTNVAKHARVKKAVVSFECDDGCVTVIIEDEGKGFLVDEVKNSGFHFGLKTMRERTQSVGGQFTIDSTLGKGTKIIVRLPLEKRQAL